MRFGRAKEGFVMRKGEVRRLVVVASFLTAILGSGAALAANGPWIVVADSGDGSGTAINLATGADQEQMGIGAEVIGVAASSGTIAFTDFVGGKVKTFQANPQGQFLSIGKGQISTAPDDPNPEGITLLGEGGRALVTDGGTVPGGNPISLILVDLASNTKLGTLPLPSVYGAAYDAATRTAWVLDGLSMQVARVIVAPDGTLHDTGARIPLNGTAHGVRFIAAYAGGSRLLVSHKLDGAVEVLDTASLTSLGRVEGVGSVIGAIAVTPDGSHALVADYGAGQWAVLDLTAPGLPVDTGTRIAVPAGVPNTFVGVHTFAFVGNKMYFSSTNGNAVSTIDWTTLTLLPESYATGLTPAGLDVSF